MHNVLRVKPGRAVGGNCPARLTLIKLMIGYYNLVYFY